MQRLTLALALAVTSAPVAAEPPRSIDNVYALMRALAPTLHANGLVARIDYEAICTDGRVLGDFPALTLRPPAAAKQEHGLDAVRARFADGHVALTLEGKVVVIRIGEPRTQILTAKPDVRLTPFDRFNGADATYAIAGSGDLAATKRLLRMHVDDSPKLRVGLITEPDSVSPHLPTRLHDLTVAGAFDEVATTFEGVVMFGTCQRPDGEFIYYADYECVCE